MEDRAGTRDSTKPISSTKDDTSQGKEDDRRVDVAQQVRSSGCKEVDEETDTTRALLDSEGGTCSGDLGPTQDQTPSSQDNNLD